MFSDWLDPDLHKRCTVVRHDPERHSNVLMPCAVCGFEAALTVSQTPSSVVFPLCRQSQWGLGALQETLFHCQ